MPKVIFFTSLSPEITPLLTQHAPAGFKVSVQPIDLPEDEKIALVQDVDFLILFPSRIGDRVLQAASQLKLIQLVSAGFDTLDIGLCQRLGISIANNGGTNAIDVAEHTLSLILGVYRKLLAMDENVRTDRWRRIDSGLTTYTIHSKQAGIIGLGQIGRQVAGLLRAFGAQVCYYDPYPAPEAVERELGVTRVSLEDLLRQSDIVTIHVPLNDATRGLIDAAALGLMKPSAILINTCRGPVVNEVDLIAVLQTDQIAGAGLDVLTQEPPDPNNPILKLENVLLTPHTAGVTLDTWSRRGEFIFQNLQRVYDGEPPLAQIA